MNSRLLHTIVLPLLLVFNFVNAQNQLPFNAEGKWGVIDTLGNIVLPPQFSGVGDFICGIAPARKNGKWTLIDLSGKTLFPYEYLKIESVLVNDSDNQKIWKVKEKDGWSLINERNEKLTFEKFEDFSVFDHYYVGHKYGKKFIGVIKDSSMLSKPYDEVTFSTEYFIALKEKESIIINQNLEEVTSGKLIDFSWIKELLLVNFKNRSILFNKKGEEVIADCDELVNTDELIAGYDNQAKKWFLYNFNNSKLNYLDTNISSIDTYYKHLIIKGDNSYKVTNGNLESLTTEDFSSYNTNHDFLNLYRNDSIFDLYNPSLEKVVSEIDLIKVQDEYYLFRKKGKYGLIKNQQVFIAANYDFFSINDERIKAYHNEGMTIFSLENMRIKEQTTYKNVVTIKSYGNMPSNANPQQDIFSRRQLDYSLYGWYRDTTYQIKSKDQYFIKWGLKEDDTSFTIKPNYSSVDIIDDKLSIAYYHRSKEDKYRVINKLPSYSVVDLINHNQKMIKNENPLTNFNSPSSLSNIHFASDKERYLIFNKDFELIHNNIPFVEQNQGTNRFRFCQNPHEIVKHKEKDKVKYSEPLIDWYSQYVPARILARYISKWKERKVEFVNAKWGYMNDSARIIIPAKYDYTESFEGEIGIVHNDGLKGAVNKSKEILPPKYKSIKQLKIDNDIFLKAQKSSKSKNFWIDSLGNPVNSQFEVLMNSRWNNNENLITVSKNERYGLINSSGQVTVPINLSREPKVKEDYIILRKRKSGVADLQGNIIVDFVYSRILTYQNNRVVFKERSKFGVGNSSGEIIIPADYKLIKLKNGVIYCENSYGSKIFDWDGNLISKEKWTFADYNNQKDTWVYRKRRKTIVKTNEEKFRYSDLGNSVRFMGDYLLVEWRKGKFNLHKIDKNHTPLFSEKYDRIEQLNDTIFKVFKRNKFGLKTIKDETIIPIRYRDLVEVFDGVYAGIYQNKLTVYNLKGEVLLSRNANEVLKSQNDLFLVKSDKGCVYYTRDMENPFFEVYQNATSFKNGYASISRKNYWTVINTYGEELFEPSFGAIVPVAKNFFYAKPKLYYGLYDTNGKELLPCIYEHIDYISGRIIRVVKNGNIGYFKPDGSWVLKVD